MFLAQTWSHPCQQLWQKPSSRTTLDTIQECVCISSVFFSLLKALTIITSVCRVDSENSGGVLFVLMSRIPDSVLLSAVTIRGGKLPESVVIKCDAPVLNDPCASLFRPLSRAKHCQDASADFHGDGGGIQGDLLRHHAAGAADRGWRSWGFCHWR